MKQISTDKAIFTGDTPERSLKKLVKQLKIYKDPV